MQDRLLRSRTDRVIGGVCGGLAHYFDLDPVIVRLIFVLLTLGGGIGILLYIVSWAIIPSEKAGAAAARGVVPPPQPGSLPQPGQPDLWPGTATGSQQFDPATFRYDPYTGQPIRQSAYPRVGDIAQPERVSATGQTIDLRREAGVQQSAVEQPAPAPAPAPAPVPVPPPYAPPYAPAQQAPRRQRGERRSQFGLVLLIIGALFLASEFGIGQFFIPVMLIVGGFLLLTRR